MTITTKRYARYNEAVTKHMKSVFGDDVVEKAYLIDTMYLKEGAIDSFNRIEERLKKCFSLDGLSIDIHFKSGKRVCFWNSEWGGLDSISEKATKI